MAAERSRWQLWLPVAFATGVGIYFGLPDEPPLWLGASALLIAFAVTLMLRARPGLLMAGLYGAFALAGFTNAQWHTEWAAAPVVADSHRAVTLEGEIFDLNRHEGAYRMVLRDVASPDWQETAPPVRVRVRLSEKAAAGLKVGDRIEIRAVLRPPPGPVAPGAYDFARRAYFERLGGVGFAVGRPHVLIPVEDRKGQSWLAGFWQENALWWSALRHRISERNLVALPGQPGAVAAALMTGERGAISETVIENMRAAGLAHLLAISGLHMGLVGGLIFFLLRFVLAAIPPVNLRFPIKKWAAVAGLLGSGFYLLLVGATIPSQRAFIMVGLVFVGVLADRRALSMRLVAWAAFLILVIAPESLLSASFQLSFAAVICLVAAYESWSLRRITWQRDAGPVHKVGLYLVGVFLTSVIAVAATAPLGAFHFNRVALYGLLANLVAVPMTAFWVMPWALLAFLLMPLGLEHLALRPMGWGLEVILYVAAQVAAWPHAQVLVASMPFATLMLLVFGGLWLCLWQRPWRFLGIGIIVTGLLLMPFERPPHIWIDGEARLIGFRDGAGTFWRSDGRRAAFEAEIWQRHAGLTDKMTWPRSGDALNGRLRCDLLGCLYKTNGRIVAFVFDSLALAEDCAVADLVISMEPVFGRQCDRPAVVIDRFDLWRNGAHAVWLDDHAITVENVVQASGRRPWVRLPGATK